MQITLPYKFKARQYQKEVFDADKNGFKRFILIWHRRAGKDKTALQLLIKRSLQEVGVYYYVFPEYNQGRKIFWDGIDNDGLRSLDHIPKELISSQSEQQMKIELVNGSIIQVVGTDRKIDNIVGTNPRGCVFSEYPIGNPKGWNLMRPILTANGGRAAFVYTPRGKNHGYHLFKAASEYQERWFVSVKTIEDTKHDDGTPIITPEMIHDERRSGMDEDLIQQEYYCSFEASVKGAYYSDQIKKCREDNRITTVPYDQALDVHTFWDIGYNDTTSIIFAQFLGKEIRIIDHEEMSGEGLEYYVGKLKERGYRYGYHYFPHDARAHNFQTGMSTEERLCQLGLNNYVITPMMGVNEGINAVRRVFGYIYIDKKLTRLIECLSDYHKERDDNNMIFRDKPKHDRASNTADSIRYLAVNYDTITNKSDFGEPITSDYSQWL